MAKKNETQKTVKYIFIASPGDLLEERNRFPKILEKINKLKAHEMGVHLEPLGWEDTLPRMGRPQKLINDDVKKCDLFVMLLWRRWGTKPGKKSKYSSGTDEEFELARKLHEKNNGVPEIFLYFRQVPEEMMADPGPQLKKVLKFRKKIEKEGALLYKQYRDVSDWEDQVTEHIARWLDGQKPQVQEIPEQALEEIAEQIISIRGELDKEKKSKADAQSKLRRLAMETAERALQTAQQGRLTEAEEMFASAMQEYAEPNILNSFGLFLWQIGRLEDAREKFVEVARTGEAQNNKGVMAAAYGNLGLIYQMQGELERAEEMHLKALAIDEELGGKEGMASQYGNLGLIYKTKGELEKAEEMQRKSLALNEELGRKEGMASCYGNLGVIYQMKEELEQAEEMHLKALAIDEELGRKEGMANQYGNLGIFYQRVGELEKAEKMFWGVLEIEKELGRKWGMANVYGNIGLIKFTRGELEKAEEMLRKALAIDEELGRKEGMANQCGNLGAVYEARGDLDDAEKMAEKANKLFEEIGAELMVEQTRELLERIRRKKKGEE